jgi:tetratricopeptide (TPR) repeat protein
MKKIYAISALCLTLISTRAFAQTPKETLEKGVETYNALREYSRTLTNETITMESVEDIKDRVEKGTILLDKVVKEGTADQIRVARYFKTNFQYELGYMYGMKGNNKAGYAVFKVIENDITAYKSSDFPMTYEYTTKIFKITWENFATTQAEYFTGMGEMSYNMGKYEDAYTMTKNSLAHKNTTNWLSYIGVNKILDIRAKQKNLVSDNEYYDFTLKSMKTYTALTTEEKKTVVDNAYPTWERGYKIFNNLVENNNSFQNLPTTIGEAAQILRVVNENEKAAHFFKYALKNNWGTATIWKNEVLPTAKTVKDNTLGLTVLGRLTSSISSTDCDNLEAFAKDYELFGDAAKAAEFKKKAEKCRQQKEADAKQAEEERQKQEERQARERRKANRDNHIFVGVNVFPLFSKPADLGGVLNFGAKKTMIELSYLKITKKKENYFDLATKEIKDVQEHKWDGYFAHVALKFSGKGFKRNMMSYSGLLFGYGQRTFEPFNANVTNTLTKKTLIKPFNPTNKQYIGMANFGYMALNRFGFDMYMGLGAAYNQFDGGNTEVWNKDGFTIEDKMVANRKPNYFSFIMRIGVSVGFGK